MVARMGRERASEQANETEREDERREEKSFVCQVHSLLGMFVCRSMSEDTIIVGDEGRRVKRSEETVRMEEGVNDGNKNTEYRTSNGSVKDTIISTEARISNFPLV